MVQAVFTTLWCRGGRGKPVLKIVLDHLNRWVYDACKFFFEKKNILVVLRVFFYSFLQNQKKKILALESTFLRLRQNKKNSHIIFKLLDNYYNFFLFDEFFYLVLFLIPSKNFFLRLCQNKKNSHIIFKILDNYYNFCFDLMNFFTLCFFWSLPKIFFGSRALIF